MSTMNSPSASQKSKLLDLVRLAIRDHQYSAKTEDAYIGWIKPCIFFPEMWHPMDTKAEEVTRFRSALPRTTQRQSASRNRPQRPATIKGIGRSAYFQVAGNTQ